jgi:hypothetical protein
MSKQTAVEWLEDKFLMTNGKLTFTEFKQAKEMEKQQIIKALGDKYNYSFSQIDPWIVTGEKYYNETYEK